jgi:hypothetical protein
VLAVLLTVTVTAFSSPGVEFGPLVLACPLWAMVLLHSWQIVGQGRRNAWFALSIEAGLLLLTTTSAPGLLLLPIGFALATPQGRRRLKSFDPLVAVLVIAVLALPYLIWLVRADSLSLPPFALRDDPAGRALAFVELLGWLLLAMTPIAVLALLNSARIGRKPDDAPLIFRPPVDPLGRQFVYCFAIAPALIGSLFAALLGLDHVVGGSGIALLLSGLAVVVATGDVIYLHRQRLQRKVWAAAILLPALVIVAINVLQPWANGPEIVTALPARELAKFFNESFERRTNHALPAVAGDPSLAALIAMGASRPHLFLDATPERTPWMNATKFAEIGGVVVWRAADTVGRPPDDIAKRFPGLVPEVPRAFERLIAGRQPLLRIGWAIVRPKAAP